MTEEAKINGDHTPLEIARNAFSSIVTFCGCDGGCPRCASAKLGLSALSRIGGAQQSGEQPVVRCGSCGGTQMFGRSGNEIVVMHDCCAKYGKFPEFTTEEISALKDLSKKQELTIAGVLRQGLRMYQAVTLGVATFSMNDDQPKSGEQQGECAARKLRDKLAEVYGHVDEGIFYDCPRCESRIPAGGIDVERLFRAICDDLASTPCHPAPCPTCEELRNRVELLKSDRRGLLGLIRAGLEEIVGKQGMYALELVAVVKEQASSLRAELAAAKNDAGLYHEIVKRLHGAFIVAGLGEWTEWQAAIDLFVKAAQAQAHLAKLASERRDRIVELECEAIDRSGELAAEREKSARLERERGEMLEALEPFAGAAAPFPAYERARALYTKYSQDGSGAREGAAR